MVVPITNGIPGTPEVTAGAAPAPLYGVARASPTTCFAVGLSVVVPITNGIPGTPQIVPGQAFLYSVACPSATTCEAVGTKAPRTGPLGPGVVVPITTGIPGTRPDRVGAPGLQEVALCGRPPPAWRWGPVSTDL